MTPATTTTAAMPAFWQKLGGVRRRWLRWRRRQAAARVLTQFERPYRLHVGCGRVHLDGWVNVDVEPESECDLVWDVNDPWPFPDASCRLIFNEHIVEHLTVWQGQHFFRECRRVLQPGGVLRVAMPNLSEFIRGYRDGDWRSQTWVQAFGEAEIMTGAEMLNVAFRNWGHQWLYDRDELQRRLRQAGFETIRDASWGESTVDELKGRETRPESQLICEAIGT